VTRRRAVSDREWRSPDSRPSPPPFRSTSYPEGRTAPTTGFCSSNQPATSVRSPVVRASVRYRVHSTFSSIKTTLLRHRSLDEGRQRVGAEFQECALGRPLSGQCQRLEHDGINGCTRRYRRQGLDQELRPRRESGSIVAVMYSAPTDIVDRPKHLVRHVAGPRPIVWTRLKLSRYHSCAPREEERQDEDRSLHLLNRKSDPQILRFPKA